MNPRDHEIVREEHIALLAGRAVVLVRKPVLLRGAHAAPGKSIDESIGRAAHWPLAFQWQGEPFDIALSQQL